MDIKAKLFEGGFEIFDDFPGEYVGIGEVVGFFGAFLAEREQIEVGFFTVVKQIKKWTYPLFSRSDNRNNGISRRVRC